MLRWASDLLIKKTTAWIQSSAQCFLIVDDDPVVQWFCIFGYLFVSLNSHTNFQSVYVNVNLRKFSGHVGEWSSLQHCSSNTLLFALMSKSDLRTSRGWRCLQVCLLCSPVRTAVLHVSVCSENPPSISHGWGLHLRSPPSVGPEAPPKPARNLSNGNTALKPAHHRWD